LISLLEGADFGHLRLGYLTAASGVFRFALDLSGRSGGPQRTRTFDPLIKSHTGKAGNAARPRCRTGGNAGYEALQVTLVALPRFGPEIKARFEWARAIASQTPSDEMTRRTAFASLADGLLREAGVLILPSAPDIAPFRGLEGAASQSFRDRTLSLTCIAGLAGLPQLSLPAGRVEDCPVGLSLIGPRGSDRALLSLAVQLS
jgi:Asp-tRNA(Asn)/Glu-tRNA(Gln) amidotransferase A subunit family amidase